MRFAFGLGVVDIIFSKIGSLSAPTAPTLTLTTGVTDNTPGFDVTNVLSGDVVRMQYDTHSDFSAALSVTGTAGSGTINIVTGALADGLWYFRARIERPSHLASDWSNTVSETIDATAPTITSAASTTVAENAALAWSIITDENATVVIGGTDAAQFELASNPSSTTRVLRWSSNGTRDFEIPADSGGNNVYNITLTPTDAVGNVGSAQNFTVTVTDFTESGKLFGFYGRVAMGRLHMGI